MFPMEDLRQYTQVFPIAAERRIDLLRIGANSPHKRCLSLKID